MSKKKESNFIAPAKESNAKKTKLFHNILKLVQQFMTGRSFTPLSLVELKERLQIPDFHLELLQEALNELVETKQAAFKNGRYSWKLSNLEVVTGVISMNPRGFGFVKPKMDPVSSLGFTQDIFIPKHLTMTAVDGDVVEVSIDPSNFTDKGPEGQVISIVERSRTHIAGIVKEALASRVCFAYVPILGIDQEVEIEPSKEYKLKFGDRVIMEVIDWGGRNEPTKTRLKHYIGHISDPSVDVDAAIEEYEIRNNFPVKAIEEAKEYGTRVALKEIKGRADYRDVETFTIDPDTAKDFDDALSIKKFENGHFNLVVHIADVSHYVKPGSHLDLEAKERCNSTYFPGTCTPMLPSDLSDNLCSLKEGVNRLAISIDMMLDEKGHLLTYKILKSVIKSDKRFTYRQAKDILDGRKKSPHADSLKLMQELCSLLKKRRYERGSIEFALPDLIVLVDEAGTPLKTDFIEYDITHQLVEEFMLKANEIVATHLSNSGKNLTYRVHDTPAEESMKDFALLAGAFGYTLNDKPSPQDLQKLFEEAMQTPYGQYLATSYIRRMRLAIYSPENIGHYGLALTHYCHFTSPIRRYVDLVVHRILFGEDDNIDHLTLVAEKCSEQERISAKAENSVSLLKKLRLLDGEFKLDPKKQYEAIITRVRNFGFYFELVNYMLEGFLHVSEIGNDYYIWDEKNLSLVGRYTADSHRAGEKIYVMLKEIDFIYLEAKWNYVGSLEKPAPLQKKGFKKTSKPAKKQKNEKRNFKSKSKGFKKKVESKRKKR